MPTKKLKSYTIIALLAVLALAAAVFGWFATQPPPVIQSSANEAEIDTPIPAEVEGGSTLFTVASEGSEARYRVQEQLAQRDLPNDAVGATNNVSGSIVVDHNGAVVPEQSRIVVDVASLESDSTRRLRPGQHPGDAKVPDRRVRNPGGARTTEPVADLRRGAVSGRGGPDRPRRNPAGHLGRHGAVRRRRGHGKRHDECRDHRLRDDPSPG